MWLIEDSISPEALNTFFSLFLTPSPPQHLDQTYSTLKKHGRKATPQVIHCQFSAGAGEEYFLRKPGMGKQ